MSSKAQPWPYVVKELRDQAAEAAVHGTRALRPVIEGQTMTREEVVRRQAIAMAALQDISRLMLQADAPIRNGE